MLVTQLILEVFIKSPLVDIIKAEQNVPALLKLSVANLRIALALLRIFICQIKDPWQAFVSLN